MPKKKTTVDPKLQARLDAKVRPDEPVKEDRIYLNMPKKKAPAKKTTKNGNIARGCGKVMSNRRKYTTIS